MAVGKKDEHHFFVGLHRIVLSIVDKLNWLGLEIVSCGGSVSVNCLSEVFSASRELIIEIKLLISSVSWLTAVKMNEGRLWTILFRQSSRLTCKNG
jgi:hypothetical protein